jgi:hypothetical protein
MPDSTYSNPGRPPGLVRDGSGSLTGQLGEKIDAAHRLLDSAELLDSEAAYRGWRDRFCTWRSVCGPTLQEHFEREAADEFYGGTLIRELPSKRWREEARAAVKTVEDMVQLLGTLQATLIGRGGGSRGVRR